MTVTVTVRTGASCGSGVSVRTFVSAPLELGTIVERLRERHPEHEREAQTHEDQQHSTHLFTAAPPVAVLTARLLQHRHGA